MTLHIKEVVAQQISEVHAKLTENMETQTGWMLKVAVVSSAARMGTTENVILSRIDQIGGMISSLAQVEYNPPPLDITV